MYVAGVGDRLIVKRMPDTGSQDCPSCLSDAPEDFCGLGHVLGDTISVDPDSGHTLLRLGFRLSFGERAALEESGNGALADSVASPGKGLTLRALLDFLWHEADLVSWSPGMVVSGTGGCGLAPTAGHTRRTRQGGPLADRVYPPEPFRLDRRAEITARRLTVWQLAPPRPGARRR